MEHLSIVELSRLIDEAPSAEEHQHLGVCLRCRDELDALRAQTESLRELPDVRPPRGDWGILHARLVSEGMVRRGDGPTWGLARTPPWMKVAAAVMIFFAGTAVGGLTFRGPMTADLRESPPSAAQLSPIGGVRTTEQSAQAVELAERQFVAALVQYNEMIGNDGNRAEDPEARLAALEYIFRASQAALREAPADPFLNGFLVTIEAEREAALRQVSGGGGKWY